MPKGLVRGGAVALVLVLGIVAVVASADPVAHNPIVITNNYEFTAQNGVVSGSGTLADPYIIEGWRIDAGMSDYGIRIHGTDRAFVIRGVRVSGAAKAGISLGYVKHGTVENCRLTGNWVGISISYCSFDRISLCTLDSNTDGIHMYFSHDNQILQNTVAGNDTGIWLDASNKNEIIANTVSKNSMGVYLELGSTQNVIVKNAFIANNHNAHSVSANQWDQNGEGNYWSNFHAIDANGDGIWDSPYVIHSDSDQDNFPLVAPPTQVQTPSSK
jgi:parallel beta-helix repeat protein